MMERILADGFHTVPKDKLLQGAGDFIEHEIRNFCDGAADGQLPDRRIHKDIPFIVGVIICVELIIWIGGNRRRDADFREGGTSGESQETDFLQSFNWQPICSKGICHILDRPVPVYGVDQKDIDHPLSQKFYILFSQVISLRLKFIVFFLLKYFIPYIKLLWYNSF